MSDNSFLFGHPTKEQIEEHDRILDQTTTLIRNNLYNHLRRSNNPVILSSVKKIVVITGGGDSSGMNAGVRGVVRTAAELGIKVLGALEGFKGLVEGNFIELNIRNVCDIIHRGGTKLYTVRYPQFKEDKVVKKAVKVAKEHGIDAVIVIGGDGSFKGALSLARHGLPCIGIPATIDNDIACTEYTIGFDTALNTVQLCVDHQRDTIESHHRCSVIEVMGANSGYLTLEAGIAVGATAILIPEMPYDIRKDVIDKIKKTQKTGKNHFIIMVAEAINKRDCITVENIAKEIQQQTGVETRATVLGYVQRGGSPTVRDRVIASRMANHAVHLLHQGLCNRVVVMQENHIMDFDIEKALDMTKEIDEDLYRCAMEISL